EAVLHVDHDERRLARIEIVEDVLAAAPPHHTLDHRWGDRNLVHRSLPGPGRNYAARPALPQPAAHPPSYRWKLIGINNMPAVCGQLPSRQRAWKPSKKGAGARPRTRE